MNVSERYSSVSTSAGWPDIVSWTKAVATKRLGTLVSNRGHAAPHRSTLEGPVRLDSLGLTSISSPRVECEFTGGRDGRRTEPKTIWHDSRSMDHADRSQGVRTSVFQRKGFVGPSRYGAQGHASAGDADWLYRSGCICQGRSPLQRRRIRPTGSTIFQPFLVTNTLRLIMTISFRTQ